MNIFIQNKYTHCYYSIIDKAKGQDRKKKCGIYYENHHILPKCLGGLNNKENLVLLNAREHFICHWLLIKMVKYNSKQYFQMLSSISYFKGKKERYYNSRLYEYAKIKYGKYLSNKPIPKERKEKISKYQNLPKVKEKNRIRGYEIAKKRRLKNPDSFWTKEEIAKRVKTRRKLNNYPKHMKQCHTKAAIAKRVKNTNIINKRLKASKNWKIKKLNGTIENIINLYQWSHLNNYNYRCLLRVNTGDRKRHKDIIHVEKI